jgi:hypothetical protein
MEKLIYISNKSFVFALDNSVEWPAILVVDIYDNKGKFINAFTVYGEDEGINFKDTIESLYERMGEKAIPDLNKFGEFLIKMQKTPERMEELLQESGLVEVGEEELKEIGLQNIKGEG